MFSQQHLLRLQHLLQPPPSRGLTPSQQQMLTLQAANQASLLSANPVLQRALLLQQMQGNLRGFNVAAAPVLQQFFPQATMHSLLGPPPVGLSLKPPHLAFPAPPFQRQNRAFRKDFPRIPERKWEADGASSSSPGRGEEEATAVGKEDPRRPGSPPSETPEESSVEDEPAAKRRRSESEISDSEDRTSCLQVEEADAESHPEDAGKGDSAGDTLEIAEELKASEVVSNAGSLKVTIQQSSESRAISTTTALKLAPRPSEMGPSHSSSTRPASPGVALKFYCYICKANCCDPQNFQTHVAGVQHQQRLQEAQQMSFLSLLPVVEEQRLSAEQDGNSQQRWCNTCQVNFMGDLIKHRRTPEHKLAKRSLRPFCTVCSRHLKTPRKFVEHMKSLGHKQKAQEMRSGEKELGGPEDTEELITVDAVGCFEEEEEEEEDEDETGEVGLPEAAESLNQQVGQKEVPLEHPGGRVEYCPDTIYGPDFLVPVAGFLCRLCHKFYSSDSAAQLTHCKSLMHFENLQRFRATRLQATPGWTEAFLQPQPGLADCRAPAPAKVQDGGLEGIPASAAPSEPPGTGPTFAVQKTPADPEMEDICGAPVMDEKSSPLPGTGNCLRQDAAVPEETPGQYAPGEQSFTETRQEAAAGSPSSNEGDAGPRKGPGNHERDPPALDGEESLSTRRRSSRRRAR